MKEPSKFDAVYDAVLAAGERVLTGGWERLEESPVVVAHGLVAHDPAVRTAALGAVVGQPGAELHLVTGIVVALVASARKQQL